MTNSTLISVENMNEVFTFEEFQAKMENHWANEETVVEDDWFAEDWDADEEVIAEVVEEKLDFSFLNTKTFATEVKKANKYIAHCKSNPLKNTNSTVTVGHDAYTFNQVSLKTINRKKRANKLSWCEAVVDAAKFVNEGATLSAFKNLYNLYLSDDNKANDIYLALCKFDENDGKDKINYSLYKKIVK